MSELLGRQATSGRAACRADPAGGVPLHGGGGYGWRELAGDASGGLIAALVALPYGLALARLMGLPPELGLFTSILTAPITSLLGRNPVLIGGTASATVPFIAAAVRAQGDRRRRQGLPGGLGLHDDLLRAPAGPARGESAACGRLGLFVRRRRDDGDPPAPHAARPARLAGRESASPILQLVGGAGRTWAQARWEPLLLGSIVVAGAIMRGAAMAALAGGPARRRPGRRRGFAAGWRRSRSGRSHWNGPRSRASPGSRPTSWRCCRRRWAWRSSRRSTS